MPQSSQSSFIPKNNAPKRQNVGRRYNFFFISLVVYGLFIATPIASAVVFIYEKHTNNIINQTTRELDAAIKSFNESDLLTVTQSYNRLVASAEVLEMSIPVNALLQFFLQNAPQTVNFTGVEVVAGGDDTVTIVAEVTSESFDYVIFYRDELLRNPAFMKSAVSDITYQGEVAGEEESGTNQESEEQTSKLSYQVSFTVPIAFLASQTSFVNDLDSETEIETELFNSNTQ